MRSLPYRSALLVSFIVASVSALASPASALYCNRRIVGTGDAPSYVRALCGEPASATMRIESRSQLVYGRGPSAGVAAVITSHVQVDTWIYDFGPNRFMIELVFEDGVLGSERTLGYGTVNGTPRAGILRVRSPIARYVTRASRVRAA
jgi:hypothetical protein